MTREQLEHAIRATCEVTGDSEIWIFGSQAILGKFPEAPEELRTSIEVDVQPKNLPDKVDAIDGALGELSIFHQTHGFYVHGLPIKEAAVLPEDWQLRVTSVFDEVLTNGNTGWCVETHDLAASKLVAYRQKDRDFVRLLLIEKMIDSQILLDRISSLGNDVALHARLIQWVKITVEEL